MSIRLIAVLWVFSLAITFDQPAQGRPFCLITGNLTQCYYMLMSDCRREAAQRDGACIVNQEEIELPREGRRFCVFTYNGTRCLYQQLSDCRREAARQDGACVVRTR
jgi:hypothetical protein